MELFIFIIIVVIIAAVVGQGKKADYEKFLKDNKITVTKKSKPFKDGKIIIFDQPKSKLWIYQPLMKKQIGFVSNQITGCELIIDNETNYSSSIASTAGRAVIGGLIAGGVGAIIGGVTSSKKGNSTVKYMQLTLSTSDLNNPYIKIVALKDSNGVKRDSTGFRTQYDNAMHWCKFIEALTHR